MTHSHESTLLSIQVLCERQHDSSYWTKRGRISVPCACLECVFKRQVLEIIDGRPHPGNDGVSVKPSNHNPK